MKAISAKPTVASVKTLKNVREQAPKLSDDAFYLLVLASLLKKMIAPVTLEQFLTPGNTVAA